MFQEDLSGHVPLEGGLDGDGLTAGRRLGDNCNRLGERDKNWNEGANRRQHGGNAA